MTETHKEIMPVSRNERNSVSGVSCRAKEGPSLHGGASRSYPFIRAVAHRLISAKNAPQFAKTAAQTFPGERTIAQNLIHPMTKIGINGFGRIGRLFFRAIRDSEDLPTVTGHTSQLPSH